MVELGCAKQRFLPSNRINLVITWGMLQQLGMFNFNLLASVEASLQVADLEGFHSVGELQATLGWCFPHKAPFVLKVFFQVWENK